MARWIIDDDLKVRLTALVGRMYNGIYADSAREALDDLNHVLAYQEPERIEGVTLLESKPDRRAELLDIMKGLAVSWVSSYNAKSSEMPSRVPHFLETAKAILAAGDVAFPETDADLLLESNELLRSFASIISRKGIETNWAALENAVGDALRRQHQRTNELRAAKA